MAAVNQIQFVVGVSLFPDKVMHIFTDDADIVREGMRYLGVIRFTYFFFVMTQVMLAFLRSMAIVKIALCLSVMTFFINCGINYVLIYGRFGLPELGVAGAAIGTLTARVLEFIVLLCFIYFRCRETGLTPAGFLVTEKGLRKDYFRVALPLLIAQAYGGLITCSRR